MKKTRRSWTPPPWWPRVTKFLGPLLPRNGVQARQWLRGRLRIRLGFETVLERTGPTRVVVRHQGALTREWEVVGV